MRFWRHGSGVQWQKNAAPDSAGQGPDAPWAHRRPGYSLPGCTPAEPDSASPGSGDSTLVKGETQRRGAQRAVTRSKGPEVSRQDRERDSGCIPGSAMAHCDAAGVNGSNRILSHGAPLRRMMPNGWLGSPVIVLLFGLDRGFLMDGGPQQVARIDLLPSLDLTDALTEAWRLMATATGNW